MLDAEPAQSIEVFQGFKPAEVAALLTRFDVINYESGSLVFQQSDHSAGMFVVLEGHFEVVREGTHQARIVAVFGKG